MPPSAPEITILLGHCAVPAPEADQPAFRRMLDTIENRFAAVEPMLHAFTLEEGRFDRIRSALDDQFARHPDPANRPPLFGVPIGVKDIFHVDGCATTAGTTLPPAVFAAKEDHCVTALRRAGAIVLGMTACAEFAFIAAGATCNPHDLEHTPGGSSSGSAAAVAAGIVPFALGTQTVGSISRPAAYCGVFGFTPSWGRVDTSGVIALAPSADHVGVLASSIAWLDAVSPVLLKSWNAAEAQRHIDTKPTLLVPDEAYLRHAESSARAHFELVLLMLASNGYEIVRTTAFTNFDEIIIRHFDVVAFEAVQVHKQWRNAHAKSYDPQTKNLLERGDTMTQTRIDEVSDERVALRSEINDLMLNHGDSLFITPAATGPAPMGIRSTGDSTMSLPFTHLGLPTIAIPAGRNADALPMSIQLSAPHQTEERLLAQAKALAPHLNQ